MTHPNRPCRFDLATNRCRRCARPRAVARDIGPRCLVGAPRWYWKIHQRRMRNHPPMRAIMPLRGSRVAEPVVILTQNERWAADPVEFAREVFGLPIWEHQHAIIRELILHGTVAFTMTHGGGMPVEVSLAPMPTPFWQAPEQRRLPAARSITERMIAAGLCEKCQCPHVIGGPCGEPWVPVDPAPLGSGPRLRFMIDDATGDLSEC